VVVEVEEMELIQKDQVVRELDNLEDQVAEEELQCLFQQEQEMLEDLILQKEMLVQHKLQYQDQII
jgi:hypothetical protein